MGSVELPDADAVIDGTAVEAVLDLLVASGLRIDAQRRALVHELLLRRAALGDAVRTSEVARLLAPILSPTPAAQLLCHQVCDRVFQSQAPMPPKPDVPEETGNPSRKAEEAFTPPGGTTTAWRGGWWWVAAGLAAALILLVLVIVARAPQPLPDHAVASANAATVSITDTAWLQAYPIEELESPSQRPWNRSARWFYTEYDAVKWTAVLLPMLLALATLVMIRRNMMAQLRRDANHAALKEIHWDLPADHFSFGTRRQNTALQHLRKLERNRSLVLDVDATIRASASAGGLFRPQYRPESIPVDFVALVDRRGGHDHLADFNLHMCQSLAEAGLGVDVLEFNADPSLCRAVRSDSYRKLTEVAAQFNDAVWLLFAEAGDLRDPVTRRWLPALHTLRGVARLILITPYAEGELSALELEFQYRFGAFVHRADPDRWPELVHALVPHGGKTIKPPGQHAAARNAAPLRAVQELSALLGERPGRWLQPSGIHPREVTDFLERLRAGLSDDAREWLALAAVYPVLRWPITVAVGRWVSSATRKGKDLHTGMVGSETALLELCRLPWFRHGAFPESLRREIFRTLRPLERRSAMGLLQALIGRTFGSLSKPATSMPLYLDGRKRPRDAAPRPDRVMAELLLASRALPATLSLPAAWLRARLRRLWLKMLAFALLSAAAAAAVAVIALSLLPVDECDLLGASDADRLRVGLGGHHALLSQPKTRQRAIAACRRAVERDRDNGRYWYQLARSLNQGTARAELREAFVAASEAVRLRYPAGYHLRGHIYLAGEGVPEDLARAEADFRKAVDLGNFSSWVGLSEVQRRQGDRVMEHKFMAMAVNAGASDVFHLAWHYREGVGVEADRDRYLQLLRLGIERRDGRSANELGWNYCCGLLKNMPNSSELENEYYRMAVKWSLSAEAAHNLAINYQYGNGVERSFERATYWSIFSAKQGHGPAMANLAALILKGKAVFAPGYSPPSEFHAQALLEAGAKQGDAASQFAYAKWLEEEADAPRETYLDWYRKAADQGYASARKAVKRLNAND
jgi:TPR repeat protein